MSSSSVDLGRYDAVENVALGGNDIENIGLGGSDVEGHVCLGGCYVDENVGLGGWK